jgi:DNA-directed RNA polymerase beta' subunit
MKKRNLTSEEIEYLVDFIKPNPDINLDTSLSVVKINKDRLKRQLKTQQIYPSLINVLKSQLKEIYESSLIHPGQSVGIICAQSIGEKNTQNTLNSIDWNDKILYDNNGKIIIEPIGNMIDTLIKNTDKKDIQFILENRTQYLPLNDGFKIPSCDENGYTKWYKIEAVTKHLPVGKLVKVVTKSGREVTATQSKSFLVWNGKKFDSVNGSDIKVGDFLPTTHTICKPRDTYDYLELKIHKKNNVISYIPNKIIFDEDFGFVFGVYLAKGFYNNKYINISIINNDKIKKKITDFFDKYRVKNELIIKHNKKKIGKIEINTKLINLKIYSVVFAKMFKLTCHTTSIYKKLPEFIYNTNDNFILGFIDGYFSCNANIDIKHGFITINNISKDLIDGISFLLNYYGIFGKIKYDDRKINKFLSILTNKKNKYTLKINNGFSQKFANIFTLTNIKKQEKLQNITLKKRYTYLFGKSQEKFPNRDVYFDEVVSVNYVKGSTKYVYDLTVEETRNFTLFNGINVRDTFHKAGQSEKSVLAGVPRFQEILNTTKEPKSKSCQLYFTKNNDTIQNLREIINSTLVEIYFENIITSYNIINSKVEKHWYENFCLLYENESWFNDYKNDIYTCHISFKLDINLIYKYKILLENIAKTLYKHFNSDLCCLFSPDSINEFDIYIDTSNIELPSDIVEFINLENKNIIYIEECVLPELNYILICGIKGIENIYYTYNDDGEWYIDTDGSNYLEIMNLPYIDKKRTISNNMWEIYEILGIEATREFLINECLDIMESINICHIKLLVERMTFSGTISSISRYTMRLDEAGIMNKASFEESTDNFLKAAYECEVENTDGVSASIICGKKTKNGTGMIDLKLDFDNFL